jgi:hypothetical protein
MDDLGSIIFIILFILFGLLGSGRKKKKPPQPRPRPRIEREEPPAPVRRAPRQPTRTASAGSSIGGSGAERGSAPPPRRKDLAEELLDFLQGKVPVERPVDESVLEIESEPEFITLDDEARASQVSDRPRASELPSEPKVEVPHVPPGTAPRRGLRFERGFDRARLRRAFIMKEIIGPPKGLE